MSDDDDFMCDSQDEEDYGFDYESDDDGSEPDADLENQYYNAKALKANDPDGALAGLEQVLANEAQKGDWGFKALKQMCKVNFRLGRFDVMMEKYKILLTYIKSAVTRNYSEKSINSILEYVSAAKDSTLLQDFYETTLNALKDAKNDRLWFKTNVKLGNMYLKVGEYGKLKALLKLLRRACTNEKGEEDLKAKGTQLLEINALEILMYTIQKNTKPLKDLYERSLHINSAIPHPLIMGTIRECGGKMHLGEEQWEKAYHDFFEAFKNYDESGSPQKISCLKYLVLANMLMKSDVDPFDAQESKPYKTDPQIVAMTGLVSAYQANDISKFETIVKENRDAIMGDPFIREYIQELLKNIRTNVLVNVIRPYTTVRVPFIAERLNITVAEVEMLLVSCILDGVIIGHMDQINGVLMLDRAHRSTSGAPSRYDSIEKWTQQLQKLHKHVFNQAAL